MIDIRHTSLNFILSTGRTGSTLLSSMLNMHPGIISVSEEPFAYNLYPKYKDVTNWDDTTISGFCYDFYLFSEGKLEPQFGKSDDLIKLLTEHKAILTGETAIKLAYFAFFPNKDKSQVTTIVDKELKFHYFLDDVATWYPQSKFIILLRDPRDNVLIKLKRAVKKKKRESVLFFAKTWNYEYAKLYEKIEGISPDRYIRVKYEDLVSAPEETLKLISDFLSVPYTPKMLDYDQKFKEEIKRAELVGDTVKQHLSMYHEGLTQKVSTEKVGIWKKELSPEDNNTIWSICEKTALSSGYEAEGCKRVSYISPKNLYDLGRFRFNKIILPNTYYMLPFSLKYLIKKMKYGKNFKNGTWATGDFYRSSIPENQS